MLTTKQKAYLKSLAMNERALFQIGKDGLNENVVETVENALRARELVTLSVLKTVPVQDFKELAFDLAMHTHSEVVQIIGRTIVLYKKNKEPKILLP